MSDLLAISGYTRDQMRGLLDAMPVYASRDKRIRVAKQYTAQDLLVVRACSQLESRYGLQRGTVVGFSDALRSVLTGPRPMSSTARLLFMFDPAEVRCLDATESVGEGLVVPLAPIFQAVDEYLLPGRARLNWDQRELGFGPQAVSSATGSAASVQATAQSPVPVGNVEQSRRTL